MIELQNISKYYGDETAVQGLSLHVNEGETLGLIGTSGCGKTTTLKMINRLVEPSSGSIFINGQEVSNQPVEGLRRKIGYVIQEVGLFPHYTVHQNVAMVPKLLDWKKAAIEKRSGELLELVGLDPETFSDRMPASLSGGQQQRVGLARALAADPPIILMDEPFGALDPITKRKVRKEINRIFTEINKTIVLVTHDVQEAFEMCDRLCLLNNGMPQQTGMPKELLFSPANDFVNSFFDANRFELEMQSITVGDIVEYLRESPPLKGEEFGLDQIKGDLITVGPEDSFSQAFEQSAYNGIQVIDKNDRPIAHLTNKKLLEGFHAVRRNLKKGQHG